MTHKPETHPLCAETELGAAIELIKGSAITEANPTLLSIERLETDSKC